MFDKSKPILGLDIGNVLSRTDTDEGDKSLQYEIEGAFSGAQELFLRFEGQVVLVSKCGVITQVRTREWLDRSHFYEITGVKPNHVFFCQERREKALICGYLCVTHFVDDRLEVLGHLKEVPCRFLFNGRREEIQKHQRHLHHVTQVASWKQLLLVCNP